MLLSRKKISQLNIQSIVQKNIFAILFSLLTQCINKLREMVERDQRGKVHFLY